VFDADAHDKIIATVATVMLVGSAPASSLNVPRAQAEVCSPSSASAISLVGSRGAFGILVIAPRACE
jgi:hypothetical protein